MSEMPPSDAFSPASDGESKYPAKDWRADCDWYFSRNRAAKGMEMHDLIEHFQSTRENPLLADHCLRRFQAAMIFLEDNLEALDFGKAVVVGSERALVSKHVIKTLYRFFVGRPDHAVKLPIPIAVFVREVQSEIKRAGTQ